MDHQRAGWNTGILWGGLGRDAIWSLRKEKGRTHGAPFSNRCSAGLTERNPDRFTALWRLDDLHDHRLTFDQFGNAART